MATVQISELTAISTATTDDNFIINDGNAATRRITFADLVTSVAGQAITFTQDIVFSGATSGITIDELDDVDTSTTAPTSGQVLAWNGSSWAPATDATSFAFEVSGTEILNRAATRGHVFKLRDTSDVNKIILNTTSGDIDSQGNLSGAQIQVNGAQIDLSDLADGAAITTLTGVSAGDVNLGTFTGATIGDNLTIKASLQALETSLEAIDIDTDDLAALTGISENTTNLGTFTGSTIADNVAVKVALQSLETSVELKAAASAITNVDNTSDADKPVSTATQTALDLKAAASAITNVDNTSDANKPVSTATQTALDLKATIATPSFTGHVYMPELRATGTGHLKLRAETGNDLNIYLNDTETLQITRDPSTGNPKFTAVGGTGECEFLQSVNLVSGFKIGGTAITASAAELNYVDGVTSGIQTQLDAKALASAISNVDNTSDADKPVSTATQTALDLKSTIDSPTFTTKIQSPEFHSAGSHLKFKAATNDIIFYPNNTETLQITRSGTDCRFTSNGGTGTFKFNQDVTQRPGSSVTPSANGDLSVEATSDTTLTFKLKGSDGTVRSGTITLS